MKYATGFGLAIFLFGGAASAETRQVGADKTYKKPCEAIRAAQAGDVIEVDAGHYDGDHCSWSTDNLTIRGVNGRAAIDAGKDPTKVDASKGIFVTTAANVTIENFELAGAYVGGTSSNGAGLRHQGKNAVIRNCYFHDNEDGILGSPTDGVHAAPGTGAFLIENSEFSHNGHGDGQSHNIYLGDYQSFTMRGSYSHDALVGHLLKSRALLNVVTGNRFDDGNGTASYEVSFPSAGRAYVVGNVIVQSNNTQNPAIIDYASETPGNDDLHLFVVNNTIVNNRAAGGTFVSDHDATTPATLQNNIFVGKGTISLQSNAIQTTNFAGDPGFVAAGSDWHLTEASSSCRDKGTDPSALGENAVPNLEYVGPLGSTPRSSLGTIDIGAYEYGNPGLVPGPDGGTTPNPGGTDPTNGTGDGGANGAANSATNGNASSDDGGCNTGGHGGSAAAGLALLGLFLVRRRRS